MTGVKKIAAIKSRESQSGRITEFDSAMKSRYFYRVAPVRTRNLTKSKAIPEIYRLSLITHVNSPIRTRE